jgi:CxxC-x17-CxxC domain-containing protein
MARFERSNDRRDSGRRDSGNRDSRQGFQRRDDGPRRYSRDRDDSNRGFRRNDRERREVEMTKVTCSSCGVECEVPFKPTSSKPLFCNDCFGKKNNESSEDNKVDLNIIKEKLNKIMKALNIE